MLQNRKPRGAVVGPQALYSFVNQARPDWIVDVHAETPSRLVKGIADGSITSEIEVILMYDGLFDTDRQLFEQAIVQYGHYCLFFILQYHPDKQSAIEEGVRRLASRADMEMPPLYFIPRDSFNITVDASIEDYCSNYSTEASEMLNPHKTSSRFSPAPIREETPLTEPQSDEGRFGRVIAVTSSKGGSGKTTVTLALASLVAHASKRSVEAGLEERPLKVCVIDMDVKDGQVSFLIHHFDPSYLALSTKDTFTYRDVEEVTIKTPTLSEVDVLIPPKLPRAALTIPVSFYSQLVDILKTKYDYIFLDTSVDYTGEIIEEFVYPKSDQIFYVTDFVRQALGSMVRWSREVTSSRELNGMGIPKEKISIIVNKAIAGVGISRKNLEDAAKGIRLISAIPNKARLITHASNTISLQEILKDTSIRESIYTIAQYVVRNDYKLFDGDVFTKVNPNNINPQA